MTNRKITTGKVYVHGGDHDDHLKRRKVTVLRPKELEIVSETPVSM